MRRSLVVLLGIAFSGCQCGKEKVTFSGPHATVTPDVYDSTTGQLMTPAPIPAVVGLQPNKSATFDQRSSTLNNGFKGSVVVSANTTVASIVKVLSGSATSLGQDYRADSYSGATATQVSFRVRPS